MAGREVVWDQVQGIVLSSYLNRPFSRYYLLEIVDAAATRAWIKHELDGDRISFNNDHSTEGRALIVGFTLEGLRKIGLPPDAIDTFPWDFRDGMVSPLRQRLLGDDPERWEWGWPDVSDPEKPSAKPVVHLLVINYSKTAEARSDQAHDLATAWAGALKVIKREDADGYQPPDRREHFGFVDGLSQPAIEASPRAQKLREQEDFDSIVQPGEFILGYVNERGQLPVSPSLAFVPNTKLPVITDADRSVSGHPPGATFPRLDFGRNGTYLVYRQLEQHVFEFAKLIREAAKTLGDADIARLSDEVDARRLIAAKMMGRWDEGTSLTLAPNAPPTDDRGLTRVNSFRYSPEDRQGLRCPIGSHVRRANPRDTLDDDSDGAVMRNNRHRILRRGRLYGRRTKWSAWDDTEKTPDTERRGIHFIALNASIESQFEFIQQTWMNTLFFGDLNDEYDPFVGVPSRPGGVRRFTIQGAPVNRRFSMPEPLVTVRGGAYFFLPSRAALRFLATPEFMNAL